MLALPHEAGAVRERQLVVQSLALVCVHLVEIGLGVVAGEGDGVTGTDAGDVGHLTIRQGSGFQQIGFQFVIVRLFILTSYSSFPVSSAYLFTPVGCRGLVEGLYLFTLYALPLTTLGVAFGSD